MPISSRAVVAAGTLLACQLATWTILHLRPGHAGIALWIFGPRILLGASALLGLAFLARFAVDRPRRPVTLVALAPCAAAGILSLSAYDVYPSSHDGAPSRVPFRLPLDGELSVLQGGATPEVNCHCDRR